MKKTLVFLLVIAITTGLWATTAPSGYAQARSVTAGAGAYQVAAPTTLPEDTDILSFTQLGFGDSTLRGPFDTASFFFGVPANWKLTEGAEVDLVLSTFYTRVGLIPQTLPAQMFGGSLVVQFNDVTLTTVLLDQVGERQVKLTIPREALTPPAGSRRHSLRLILDSGINCDIDFDTTVAVRSTSQLFLPHELVEPPTDLTRLPFPLFQDSFLPDSAVVVVPAQPTASELQAALAVAAGFGRMTFSRLLLSLLPADQLTPEVAGANHLIFVGKAAAFSALSEVPLPAPASSGGFNAVGASPGDGIIQLAVSPWNKAKVVLVVGGNDDGAVVKAGQAISTGAVRIGTDPALSLVSDVQPGVATGPTTVDRKLSELGFDNVTVSNVGLNSVRYRFDVPPGYTLGSDAYLELGYAHSALLEYERSGVIVQLNGEPVGSVRFSDETAGQGQSRINLPASAIRAGSNRLDVDVDLVPRNVCVDPLLAGLWMRIDAASLLHLPLSPIVEGTSPLLDLSQYPAPYALDPLLGDLAFVLAQSDPVGWDVAAQIAFALGDTGAIRLANLTAAYGDSVPAEMRQARNLIIVGRPSKLPITSELAAALPAPFEAGNDLAIERNVQVAYHLQPGVNVGYLELLAAPWNSQRAILLVAGSTDQGLQWAGAALKFGRLRSQLTGNLAFVNGEQVVATDTRLAQSAQSLLGTAAPGSVIPVDISAGPPIVQRPVWIIPALVGVIGLMIAVMGLVLVLAVRRRRAQQ